MFIVKDCLMASVDEILGVRELETWIDILSECKQLREEDVKRLCEKALNAIRGIFMPVCRPRRFW